jgi:uncharacterized membrane protein
VDDTCSQREINDAEWRNPDNWSDNWFFRAYFSKRDSRLLVPRYFNNMFMPTTPNFGHRRGVAFVSPVTILAAIITGYIGWFLGRV